MFHQYHQNNHYIYIHMVSDIFLLQDVKEEMARDFIPALGGSIVERPEEATHAVAR